MNKEQLKELLSKVGGPHGGKFNGLRLSNDELAGILSEDPTNYLAYALLQTRIWLDDQDETVRLLRGLIA